MKQLHLQDKEYIAAQTEKSRLNAEANKIAKQIDDIKKTDWQLIRQEAFLQNQEFQSPPDVEELEKQKRAIDGLARFQRTLMQNIEHQYAAKEYASLWTEFKIKCMELTQVIDDERKLRPKAKADRKDLSKLQMMLANVVERNGKSGTTVGKITAEDYLHAGKNIPVELNPYFMSV